MNFGGDVVGLKGLVRYIDPSRHGLEEHFFEGFGRVEAHQDPVAVTAFLQLARAGIVEPLPKPGREHQRHVGVVQAVVGARGDQSLEYARRARPGEPSHPQKRRLWGAPALAPPCHFTPHEAHVHVGVVQKHAVQELVQRRVAGRTQAGSRGHAGQGPGQEKGECAACGDGHKAFPRQQEVEKPFSLKQPGHADEQGTDPQQQEEGKEGAEQAACGGLEGGELDVVVAVREHAVEDRDTLDGKAMKEGRISAQQQQGGVARDRQQDPRSGHVLTS